jgi:hypothetical protein
MADITGNWEFHRSCPSEGMTNFGVDTYHSGFYAVYLGESSPDLRK